MSIAIQKPDRRRQQGFSLVELMIAMAIGVVLLVGVVVIGSNSSRTHRDIEQLGSQIENGRYAMQLLQREVQHAGYYGEYYDLRAPAAEPSPCVKDPTVITDDVGLPIQGYDNVSGNPSLTCLDDADHRDGTDILVVRRASTTTSELTDPLIAGELYIQSRAMEQVVAQADGNSDDETTFHLEKLDNTPASIRKLRTDIYFIGPDEDDVPTLKRLSLVEASGGLVWREEPLATGVENLQIEYGVDSDGNGTAHDYETNPATVTDWSDVIAMRVYMVVRTTKPSETASMDAQFDLGLDGSYDPPDDGYRRASFVSAIRLANMSMRRE